MVHIYNNNAQRFDQLVFIKRLQYCCFVSMMTGAVVNKVIINDNQHTFHCSNSTGGEVWYYRATLADDFVNTVDLQDSVYIVCPPNLHITQIKSGHEGYYSCDTESTIVHLIVLGKSKLRDIESNDHDVVVVMPKLLLLCRSCCCAEVFVGVSIDCECTTCSWTQSTTLFGGSVTCLDAFHTEAMSLGYMRLL